MATKALKLANAPVFLPLAEASKLARERSKKRGKREKAERSKREDRGKKEGGR